MSIDDGQEANEDELKLLSEAINEPALRSSVRVLILISLALNRHLSFTDLIGLTGLGKGSLSNHIDKLEASGFIQSRLVRTFRGQRMVISITPRGLEAYRSFMELLRKIGEKR
ncbi:MAG: transcriptional regulator [Conexivisphaerales archaeon]